MIKRKRVISVVVVVLAAAGTIMFLRGNTMSKSQYKINNFHNEIFGENVYIFSPEDNP